MGRWLVVAESASRRIDWLLSGNAVDVEASFSARFDGACWQVGACLELKLDSCIPAVELTSQPESSHSKQRTIAPAP